METLAILQFILLVLTILGVILGWLRASRERGEYQQKMKSDIAGLQATVTDMKEKAAEKNDIEHIKEELRDIKMTAAVKADILAVKQDITQVKSDISEIRHTLGNGGYTGIKQDIQSMKIQCAGEMGRITERLNGLEKKQE